MQIPHVETHEHGGTMITDLLRIRVAEGHDTHGQVYQEVVIQTLADGTCVHQEIHTSQTYVLRAAAPATEVVPG